MDKQIYLYKLNKYKLKLESQPYNVIYQQKVTHYEHMSGGLFGGKWKQVFSDTSKTIYNYKNLFVTKNHNNQNNNFYIGTNKTTIDATGNFIGDTDKEKRLIECRKQLYGDYATETVNCKITTEGFLYNNRGYHLLNIIIENIPSFSIKAVIKDNANNNPSKIDLLKESSKISF